MKKGLLFVAMFLLLGVAPQVALGESIQPISVTSVAVGEDEMRLPGTVDCFDYYTFGSVQVDVIGSVAQAVAGSVLTFSGAIRNENMYPVVDGAAYMKVFALPESGDRPRDGYDIVYQGFVMEDVALPAGGEVAASFDWTVPAHLPKGSYRAVFFFSSAKKFNLLGLPFTDDVVGNSFDFTVSSEITDRVYLRKDTVTLNDEPFHFASVNRPIGPQEAANVEVDLSNPTEQDENIEVVWKLYKWDQQDETKLIKEYTQQVAIAAGTRERLSFVVEDNTTSAYMLVVETVYRDVASVLDVRIGRKNIPSMRINFPAVMSYPLVAGKNTDLFSCLHVASNLDLVEGGKLVLSLSDDAGSTIHSYTYEGSVTGRMMAVMDSFTPNATYDTFTLQADLYRDNQLVDSATMHYDCESLGGCDAAAPEVLPTVPQSTRGGGGLTMGMTMVLILLLVVVLVVVGYIVLGGKKHKRTEVQDDAHDTKDDGDQSMTPPSSPPAAIMLALVMGAGALLMGQPADASVIGCVKSSNYSGVMYSARPLENPGSRVYTAAIVDPQATVSYTTAIYDADTNALIAPGEIIGVGDNIRFEMVRGEISYNISGYYYDTPYGDWVTNAAHPGGALGTAMLYGPLVPGGQNSQLGQCDGRYYWGVSSGIEMYAPFSVHPENPVRTTTGTAGLSCVGDTCAVTSAGTIETQVSFPQTYGYFYRDEYRWSSVGDTLDYLSVDGVVSAPAFQCQSSWGLAPLANYQADIDAGPVTPYQMIIPECTTDYDISAVDTSAVAVTVDSCDLTGGGTNNNYEDEVQKYRIEFDGPSGDEHRCGIDYDLDDVIDVVSTGYTTPGTGQDVHIIWSTEGSHTFRVRCRHRNSDSYSPPTEHTVNIINKPPDAPVVTDVVGNTFQINDTQFFDVYATDKNGDEVRYEVDFDQDSTWETCLPAVPAGCISTVPSGDVLQTSNMWSVANPYSFNVRAVDEHGDPSAITTHTITISAANTAPAPPDVRHLEIGAYLDGKGEVGVAQTFEIETTDAESNNVYYGIDWGYDSTVDLWIPDLITGGVAPTAVQTFQQTWLAVGTEDFQVLARDDVGALSTWTDVPIELFAAVIVEDGDCGPVHDLGVCVTSLDMMSPGLCDKGSLASFTPAGTSPDSWTWDCVGINSAIDDLGCTASECVSIPGACGEAHRTCGTPPEMLPGPIPNPDLCDAGNHQNYQVVGDTTSWECLGTTPPSAPCITKDCVAATPQ